ncbi:MAG: DUF58 domain-containing protein [Clostridiaceae bacterium]|nr:DUF58 domain-containing protein [Clostridiaceae bacterium]
MFVSKRFILLVAMGVIPAALSFIPGIGVYALLAYNFLLVTLLVVDFSLSPRIRDFGFRREIDQILSLSAWNRIGLCIENPVKYRLKAKLRDSVPESFGVDKEVLEFEINPGRNRNIFYRVKPTKRGEYVFPDLHVRITGVLGLCVLSKTIKIADKVKVYPNLKDLRNSHLLIVQKKRLLAGLRKIRSLGVGTEFESIREYSQGDDFRHINWNVTARTGHIYVNHYEPERNQYVYLMMDTSMVMNEEINEITKLDYAVNAAFIVAETAINYGDNIGLISFDSEINRIVAAGKGRGHFQRLAESMYNIQTTENYADYQKAFTTLQREQNRQSLVLLFTDPYNFEHAMDIVNSWKVCAPRHRVMVLCIKNPALYGMAEKEVLTTEDIFSKSAAMKLVDDRHRTFSVLEKSGIHVLESAPDRFTLEAVNRYIAMKTGYHSLPFQQ